MKPLIYCILLVVSVSLFSCSEKRKDNPSGVISTAKDKAHSIPNVSEVEVEKDKHVFSKISRRKKRKTDFSSNAKTAVTSISETSSVSDSKAMDSLYAALDKASEVFLIDTSKDTVLTCAEGTIISIPANCFLDKKKKRVSGIVKFEVKEYYSPTDMLFASLNSVSDGNLMETGGMLYLQANANNSKLTLAANKTVKIEMPTETIEDGMQLFYGHGNDNKLNWKKGNRRPAARKGNAREIHRIAQQVSYVKNNQPKIEIDNYSTSNKNSLEVQEMRDTVVITLRIDSKGRLKDYTLMLNSKYINKPYVYTGYYKTYFRGHSSFINTRNRISFGRSHGIHYSVSRKASFHGLPLANNSIELSEENLKKIKKAFRRNDSTITVTLSQVYLCINDRMKQKAIKDKVARMAKDSTVKLTAGEAQYYIFDLNNLGWINCDRFYNTPSADKTTYRIAANESKQEDVKIIFNDIKSIMQGSPNTRSIDFNEIPKQMDITVIGMRYKNSRYEFATAKTNTSEENTALEYFPVRSILDIKEKIAAAVKVE